MYDTPKKLAYRDAHADCENNILTLPDAARSDIIARIAAHSGTIRAYIHPFFILHAEQEHTHPDFSPTLRGFQGISSSGWTGYYQHKRTVHPSIDTVEKAFRDAVLTHATPDEMPLLVFEEGHRVQNLIRELRDASLLPYIVPTMDSNPTPLVRDPHFPSPWGTLRELLRDIGVRNIELGGMLSHMCVTRAETELQKAFYVDTLLPVHPPKNQLTVDHFGL
ncbi:MAG: hypothetical protein WC101_00190 [Candidatus Gracilibacteria bacterium]